MAQDEKIMAYCTRVCSQIRWKKTHKGITEELKNHLQEQRDAYIDQGCPEEEAEDKAIRFFGDAVAIGAQLDRIHRPKSQWLCFAILALLCLSGLYAQNLADQMSPYGMMPQLASYLLGAAVLAGVYFLDVSFLSKCAIWFYGAVVAGCVVLWTMSIYVNLRSCIVFLFPLAIACGVYHCRGWSYWGIGASMLFAAVLLGLSVWGNHAAGVLLSLASVLTVLPFAICKGWFRVKRGRGLLLWALPLVVGGAIATAVVLNRGLSRFYPTDSYITTVLREVLQSARWIGMGQPLARTLPAMHTDYILTFIIGRFGWLAFGFVVLLLLMLLILCFRAVGRQKSVLGQLVAFAITVGFTVQMLGYCLVNLGVAHFPSLTLPFVSYGSFANLIHFALLGLMLSVFRNGEIMTDTTMVQKTKIA